MKTIIGLVVLLLVASASASSAQLSPGVAIRVGGAAEVLSSGDRRYSNKLHVGTVLDLRGDTLVLASGSSQEETELLLDDHSKIETRGRVPAKTRGTVIGLVVGFAIGGLMGHVTFTQEYEEGCVERGRLFGFCERVGDGGPANSRGTAALKGTLIGGVSGLVVGRLVGGQLQTDGWVQISGGRRLLSVRLTRVGQGWGPSLQVSF